MPKAAGRKHQLMVRKAGMPTADGKNYFSYFPREITLDSCRDAVSSGRIDRAIRTVSGGSANLYGGGHPDDVPFFFGAGDGTRSDYFVRNQKIVSERFASGGDRFSRMLVMAPMTAHTRAAAAQIWASLASAPFFMKAMTRTATMPMIRNSKCSCTKGMPPKK